MMNLPPSSETPRVSYGILARLFIRLSLTTFGGPAAHIAIAEEEIVTRRRWLTREHYLDLIAATNLIPGPNATEVMIHIGYLLRGFPGAVLAGACFIVPPSLLSLALAVLYVGGGSLPQIASVLAGIKPVIVAIIAGVGYRLLRTALRKTGLWMLFGLSILVIVFSDVPEVLVMLGAGLLYALVQTGSTRRLLAGASGMALAVLPPLANAPAGIWDIFWYFLKIGSVLFGSGYVLIAYIQQDLVNNFSWLTGQQLLDSIAIGQMTPGPLSTTVTVVGYIVAGVPGAIIGTCGFFLPSFVLVILTAPLIPRMRRSPFLSAFLSGINAGVIAAILITLVDLANTALRAPDGGWSPAAIVLALAALVLLLRFRVSATGLILLGGLSGLAAQFARV